MKYFIPLIIFVSFAAFLIVIINDAYGIRTDVGEPYVVPYTSCDYWIVSGKGVSTCGRYSHHKEMRVDVEVKGLFFTTKSYRIIKPD